MKFSQHLTLATVILAMAASLATPFKATADTYPKREVRGVWMSSLGIDWPVTSGAKGTTASTQTKAKTECTTYLDALKAAGINTVYFHVRAEGDRCYALNSYTFEGTKYTVSEPWSKYVSGTRGTSPGWDPLAFWVDECHKRNMECFAWVNPYRQANKAEPYSTTPEDAAVQSWLICNGNRVCFDPAKEATKARIRNVCIVLTGNYDIDGIVFDDYFYPAEKTDFSVDADEYQAYQNAGGTLGQADWRRRNCSDMVAMVNTWIHKVKPWVKFGISPRGAMNGGLTNAERQAIGNLPNETWSDGAYVNIYGDAVSWLREQSIDFISPQLYWPHSHKTNPFDKMTEWSTKVAKYFGRHFYASQALYNVADYSAMPADEMLSQVNATRSAASAENTPMGTVFFSNRYLVGAKNANNVNTALKTNCFQQASVPPEITWRGGSDPGCVQNLQKTSTQLKWTAIGNNRYIAYAIPLSVSPSQAVSDKGGYLAEYILEVPYTNSVTLPDDKKSGYWYAVAVLDRYGHEWDAATINAPVTEPTEVTLTSPADGAKAAFDQQFVWTGTAGATFTFEVSTVPDFATITYTHSGVDLLAEDIDFRTWSSNRTLYWRVRAAKTGYVTTTSPARTVVTPTKPDAEVTLVSPVDGAEAEPTQQFCWAGTEGATFTVELSATPDFATVVRSVTTTETEASLSMASLDEGSTAYWRVRASAPGFNDVASAPWSIKVPTAPTATAAKLLRPEPEQTFGSSDAAIQFVYGQTGADETWLEVSRDADFSTIYYSTDSGIANTGDVTWFQHTVAIDALSDGTYYWRVRTVTPGMHDGLSEVRTFTVSTDRHGLTGAEKNYEIYREPYDYSPAKTTDGKASMLLTNLWLRNADHNPMALAGNLSRDIAVRGDIIYLACRKSESASAASFLARYDINTGERLSDLNISYDQASSQIYRPCNNVIVDESGNLIVSDMVMPNKTVRLVKVNPETGAGTTVVTMTNPYRVDHITVVGTVATTGEFDVYAPAGGTDANKNPFNKIYHWHFANGKVTSTGETTAITTAAARVQIISGDLMLVDDPSTFPQYRQFGSADVLDDLTDYNMFPNCPKPCGATAFVHGNQAFVTCATDGPQRIDTEGNATSTADNYKWSLFSVKSLNGSFAGKKTMFTFPQGGLGHNTTNGGDWGAPVVAVQLDNDGTIHNLGANTTHTTLIAYSPDNGMAAYALTRAIVTGVDGIEAEGAETADEWYTLQGVRVAAANLAPGFYLHRAAGRVTKQLVK